MCKGFRFGVDSITITSMYMYKAESILDVRIFILFIVEKKENKVLL